MGGLVVNARGVKGELRFTNFLPELEQRILMFAPQYCTTTSTYLLVENVMKAPLRKDWYGAWVALPDNRRAIGSYRSRHGLGYWSATGHWSYAPACGCTPRRQGIW